MNLPQTQIKRPSRYGTQNLGNGLTLIYLSSRIAYLCKGTRIKNLLFEFELEAASSEVKYYISRDFDAPEDEKPYEEIDPTDIEPVLSKYGFKNGDKQVTDDVILKAVFPTGDIYRIERELTEKSDIVEMFAFSLSFFANVNHNKVPQADFLKWQRIQFQERSVEEIDNLARLYFRFYARFKQDLKPILAGLLNQHSLGEILKILSQLCRTGAKNNPHDNWDKNS